MAGAPPVCPSRKRSHARRARNGGRALHARALPPGSGRQGSTKPRLHAGAPARPNPAGCNIPCGGRTLITSPRKTSHRNGQVHGHFPAARVTKHALLPVPRARPHAVRSRRQVSKGGLDQRVKTLIERVVFLGGRQRALRQRGAGCLSTMRGPIRGAPAGSGRQTGRGCLRASEAGVRDLEEHLSEPHPSPYAGPGPLGATTPHRNISAGGASGWWHSRR